MSEPKNDEIVVGSVIMLDCGYGAHSFDAPCRVLAIQKLKGLFGGVDTVAAVVELGGNGERFHTTLKHEVTDKTKQETK